jgi:hypothetical protein
MALFRVDFSGRGELSERQQKVRLQSFHIRYFVLMDLEWIARPGALKVDETLGGIQCPNLRL